MCCASPSPGPLGGVPRSDELHPYSQVLISPSCGGITSLCGPRARRLSSGKRSALFTARKSIRGWLHTRPACSSSPRVAQIAPSSANCAVGENTKSTSNSLHTIGGISASRRSPRTESDDELLPGARQFASLRVVSAFFRPEVILKYKTDKDKYTVGERDITCRAAWHLQAFDVNEAGQVFAYICYLRNLPYAEQVHWHSYNEAPRPHFRACNHQRLQRASSRPSRIRCGGPVDCEILAGYECSLVDTAR